MSSLLAVCCTPGAESIDVPQHWGLNRRLSTDSVTCWTDGLVETSAFSCDEESSSGWTVAGLALTWADREASFVRREQWASLLSSDSFDPTSLDGHFVAVRWKAGHVECFTDQLGIRTLYLLETTKGTVISTRLDWVVHFMDDVELDTGTLGASWLTFNQFTCRSLVRGIHRLGQDGRAEVRDGTIVRITETRWSPDPNRVPDVNAFDIMQTVVTATVNQTLTPSSGLSGGLDSRFLLAQLLRASPAVPRTHTCGEPSDPDVQIANQIAAAIGTEHRHFNDGIPPADQAIAAMRSYAAQMNLTEAVTVFQKLSYYPRLRKERCMLIDGGWGEIARRRLLARLVTAGKSAVKSGRPEKVFQYLLCHRADIFTPDFRAELERGAIEDLALEMDAMPPVGEIGIEDYADLFSVRTRMPNYSSPDQARIDGIIPNLMPSVQPTYLQAVFAMPLADKRNGRRYRERMETIEPRLARFPLVKSGFTYPYHCGMKTAWLITKAKSIIKKPYHDRRPDEVLARVESFVRDRLESRSFRENSLYDRPAIEHAVQSYYAGELSLRPTVEWWLTFDLWQESLQRST